MRELDNSEIDHVAGGALPIPIIAAVASFLTHTSVRTVGQYYLSRGLTAYAVYGAAEYASTEYGSGRAGSRQ